MSTQDILLFICMGIGSFFITFMLVPKISNIMYRKKILDQPNERSSHSKSIPNLGGIPFFIILMLSTFFIEGYDTYNLSHTITPGLTILFIIGLKDDLLSVSPLVKLGSQVLSSLFIVSHDYFRITNLHGFLGINELPFFFSLFITVFIIIAIINAFNLIDGIDGLASVIASVKLTIFAVIFTYFNKPYLAVMCIILIASIFAFLRYNLSYAKKIFMGDTGSMTLGFIIAIMSISFINLMGESSVSELFRNRTNMPFILLAILIVPFFDTIRIFSIRLLNKKGPFKPDRNHTHHILIDFKHFSHIKTSLMIGLANILIVIIFYFSAQFANQIVMSILSVVLFIAMVIYFFRINKNRSALRMKAKLSKLKK